MQKRLGILVFVLLLALGGCQSLEADKVEANLVQGVLEDPRQTAIWTKLAEVKVDLDQDGRKDFLGLYTMAERDEQGHLLWDDGQNWLLVVQSGEQFYPLFAEYVQLGQVYFTVSRDMVEDLNKVTVLVTTGAGMQLFSYLYDSTKQGFLAEEIYHSPEDNFLFNSIPSY